LLGLDDFEINYIDSIEYFKENKEFFKIGKLYHIHGHELKTYLHVQFLLLKV
jgi:hypothetical protein